MTEDARVVCRNLRRDANSLIKDVDGFSEDDQHRALKDVQDVTDAAIKRVDDEAGRKEAEIMEV